MYYLISLIAISYAIVFCFFTTSRDSLLPYIFGLVLTAIACVLLAKSLKFSKNKVLSISLYCLIIVLACIYGNYLKNRTYRDTSRHNDIVDIKMSLTNYYQTNKVYPDTLEGVTGVVGKNLNDYKDPSTKKPYSYKVLPGGQTYELCADYEGKGYKGYECVGSNN